MGSPFDTIAIVSQANWRYFAPELVKVLKARHGSKVHMYCTSELHAEYYRGIDSEHVFDSIQAFSGETPAALPVVHDKAAVLAKARANELRYGRTIMSLTVTNKHFARGYALGGFHHPRSMLSEESSYEQVLQIMNDQIDFWEHQIRDKGIGLFLNLRSDVGYTVANGNGVPVRNIYESRFKSYLNWAVDHQLTNPQVRACYDAISPESVKDLATIEGPPKGHAVARDMVLARFTTRGLLRDVLKTFKEQAYNRYKGNSVGRYYLTSHLSMLVRRWRDGRWLLNGTFPWLRDLGDQPFVFFPLHSEPEASLQGQAPDFLSQIWAVVSLARNLPAHVRLVVKEHLGAVGRRPADFYDQILALKNVVMLDVRELGKEVVEKSTIVATISGTAGLEAAAMGKPVLTFGRRNIYNFLPHVKLITDEAQIKGAIENFLSPLFDAKTAAVNGARYVQAVATASFDLRNYNHLTGLGYTDAEVETVVDRLEESLGVATGAAKAPVDGRMRATS